ncbi:hypothetical protein HK100_003700 [Physocladia obscura]|uniref:Uncharacterized protein n=1 Tax=Physocladia obscura TaxID=109957 RepID=A0AAD5SWC2_9FUNG|nr:hypothetical protein HK100_003700 [Physocladia obscura]
MERRDTKTEPDSDPIDPTGQRLDTLSFVGRDAQWRILERFSRVTSYAQHATG